MKQADYHTKYTKQHEKNWHKDLQHELSWSYSKNLLIYTSNKRKTLGFSADDFTQFLASKM